MTSPAALMGQLTHRPLGLLDHWSQGASREIDTIKFTHTVRCLAGMTAKAAGEQFTATAAWLSLDLNRVHGSNVFSLFFFK